MRRALPLFLILFFALGPLAATLPGDDESRLPPCCRRHGAHHCSMSAKTMARMAKAVTGSGPTVYAPSTCPCYPGYAAASTTPAPALTAPPASLPVLLAQAHSLAATRAAARLSQIRTRAGRSPPPDLLG